MHPYSIFQTQTINTIYHVDKGEAGLKEALDNVCLEAAKAAASGYTLLVLSDKRAGRSMVPIR